MQNVDIAERMRRLSLKIDNYDRVFAGAISSARRKVEFADRKERPEEGEYWFAPADRARRPLR